MTLRTATAQGVKLLKEAGVDEPSLTAQVLLAHALRQDRVYLFAHSEDELPELGWIHYGRYLHERLQGKPLQYITHRQEFYGRDFYVAPGVLIPRPETELLVELLLPVVTPGMRVLDIGAGSGCIGITVALETRSRVFATDVSADALGIARRNAETHQAAVVFTRMDLGTAFASGTFDVVVSNPPYVPECDKPTIAREVQEHEPALALFAGEDGLSVYRRLIPEAARLLQARGTLYLELGAGQARDVVVMCQDWAEVQVFPDLAGIERMLVARR